jgi:hypothetical protein
MPSNLSKLVKKNRSLAKQMWSMQPSASNLETLTFLSEQYKFSIALGDLLFLDGTWYVTHAGLLRLAHRTHCAGIRVDPVREFCDGSARRWVFKATVFKSRGSCGFVGYGDADPSNTSFLIRGAEMRLAESRAVSRALRKAYGIGSCSFEELGSAPSLFEPTVRVAPNRHGSANGQTRLRDKLCLLIRRYELDPNLIKRYAADFCGTESLRDATRELVEAFVSTVAKEAANDRAALICKLNSYCQPEEVRP